MTVFPSSVVSPAAHQHSRDLLPPDHVQSGPASQSGQQRHSNLGNRPISCIPRTHHPPQSVGQFASLLFTRLFVCHLHFGLFTLLRRTASAPATASSFKRSLLTPPPRTRSTKHSWLWKPMGGARRNSWRPRVSWRGPRTLSRKVGKR